MIDLIPIAVGIVVGIATQLNLLAALPDDAIPKSVILTRIALGSLLGPCAVLMVRRATRWAIGRLVPDDRSYQRRFLALDGYSFLPLLLIAAGAFGVPVTQRLGPPILLAVIGLKFIALYGALDRTRRQLFLASRSWLAALFFCSGFAALIYQIVWQRVLFSIYGSNIESITVVVAIFMLGLGLGSLWGGHVSRRIPDRLPAMFLIYELAIGLFGAISLPLIKAVGAATLQSPPIVVTLTVGALLLPPTMLMGATLPTLVAYLNRQWRDLGRSVSRLYFINTLGSAVACIATADILFAFGGMQTAVLIAAFFNGLTGVLVFRYLKKTRQHKQPERTSCDASPAPAPWPRSQAT